MTVPVKPIDPVDAKQEDFDSVLVKEEATDKEASKQTILDAKATIEALMPEVEDMRKSVENARVNDLVDGPLLEELHQTLNAQAHNYNLAIDYMNRFLQGFEQRDRILARLKAV